MKLLFLLIALTAIISCNDASSIIKIDDLEDITSSYKISQTNSFDNEISLILISSVDDLYLVSLFQQRYLFALYDKDFNKLLEFGLRGRGPNEFNQGRYNGQYNIIDGHRIIDVYDMSIRMLYKIDLDSTIQKKRTVIHSSYHLPITADVDPNRLFYLDENTLLGIDSRKDCKTFSYNTKSNELNLIPQLYENENKEHSQTFCQSTGTINLKTKKYCSAFLDFPQLDFYSLDNNVLKRTKTIFYNKKLKTIDNPSDNVSYNQSIGSNEDNIFTLLESGNKILVCDWDGVYSGFISVPFSTGISVDKNKIILTNATDDEADNICTIIDIK